MDLENRTRPSTSLSEECSWTSPTDEPAASVKVETELERGSRSGNSIAARVQLTVKIVRAHGGCLGTRRRRRTWTAAISHGEALNSH